MEQGVLSIGMTEGMHTWLLPGKIVQSKDNYFTSGEAAELHRLPYPRHVRPRFIMFWFLSYINKLPNYISNVSLYLSMPSSSSHETIWGIWVLPWYGGYNILSAFWDAYMLQLKELSFAANWNFFLKKKSVRVMHSALKLHTALPVKDYSYINMYML